MNSQPKPRVVLSTRLPPSLKAALAVLAKAERRSMSQFVELLIERAVEDAKRERKREG